jgi:hypothetical protein
MSTDVLEGKRRWSGRFVLQTAACILPTPSHLRPVNGPGEVTRILHVAKNINHDSVATKRKENDCQTVDDVAQRKVGVVRHSVMVVRR